MDGHLDGKRGARQAGAGRYKMSPGWVRRLDAANGAGEPPTAVVGQPLGRPGQGWTPRSCDRWFCPTDREGRRIPLTYNRCWKPGEANRVESARFRRRLARVRTGLVLGVERVWS